jgi:hypothetical protein
MPYGAQIRPESLERLIQQIGEQLLHVAPPDLLNAGPIELRESFEVWALGLDALGHGVHSKRQIRQLARPVDRWHHQLAFGGRVAAFARSSSSPSTGRHQLEELFISPLAQRIDDAIGWIDENAAAEEHARLLTAPACHMHAFWLEDDELKSRLLLIDAPGSPQPRFQIHDESEFLRDLSLATTPAGVLLAGNRVLAGT